MMLSEETSAVRPQKQTRFNGAKLVWMLKGSPLTVTGAVIIVLMLLMMIFSPWLATHDPNAIDLTARLLPPSAAHWFGTDEVGRDLFSRVLVEYIVATICYHRAPFSTRLLSTHANKSQRGGH